MYLKSKNYKYLTMLSNSDLSFNDGLFLCMYKASESLRFRVLRCMSNITTLSKRGVVYEIVCNLYGGKCQGETDRPLNNRIVEHIRAAKNPQSYPNNALGHHYNTAHPNCQVDISVVILDIQRNTLKRKLSEALYIHRNKPSLNDKSELESIVKYL